ncbi:MAG: NRDE family protein [Akkermansiaceae bacterium]
MSWETRSGGERVVFFNRDEMKTRPVAAVPERFVTGSGLSYLAPIDPGGGGSWLAVNDTGLVVALLNRWHEQPRSSGVKYSRGKLVIKLAAEFSVRKAAAALSEMDLLGYLPFTIVFLDREKELVFAWDGSALWQEEITRPLTSSSFNFQKVKRNRETLFSLGKSEEVHSGTGDTEPSAYTVRMNRPDAQTWSRSKLVIGQRQIDWEYWEEMPNLAGEPRLHCSSLATQSHSV